MDLSKLGHTRVDSAPTICIYGPPGIGKTAFAIGAGKDTDYKVGKENHILMNLDFRGADRLICTRMFNQPVESADMIKDGFSALFEQTHKFTWLVIDDLSSAEELFVNEVCKEHNVDNLKKIEYGRGYELARVKWYGFFEMIRAIQEAKHLGVVLIGHTKIDTQKDPMSESYSKHDLQLDKRSKEIIKKSVDLIGFAHKKTLTKQVDAAFGKKEYVPVGESERVLTLAPDREGFDSKDRFNFPEEIPLDWNSFEGELNKYFHSVAKSKKGEK